MVALVGVKFMKKIINIIELVGIFIVLGFLNFACVKVSLGGSSTNYSGLDIWFGQHEQFETSTGITIFSFLWLAAVIISIVKLCQKKPNQILSIISCVLLVICGILCFMGTSSSMINPKNLSYKTFDALYDLKLAAGAVLAGIGFIVLGVLNLYDAIKK